VDAVRVQHGDNFEHQVVAQLLCNGMRADQKVDEALAHEGGRGLARVNPGGDEDHSLLCLIGEVVRVADGQQVEPPLLHAEADLVLSPGAKAPGAKAPGGPGAKALVLKPLVLIPPGAKAAGAKALGANALVLKPLVLIPAGAKALGAKALPSTNLVGFDILHGEVEPDPVALVASVRPDEQVVLELADEVHPAQVAALEAGVEHQVALLRLARVAGGRDAEFANVANHALLVGLLVAVASMLVCGLALAFLMVTQTSARVANGEDSQALELKRGKRMAPGRILMSEYPAPSTEEVYYYWPESKRAPNVFRWGKRANVFRWGKRANVFRWGKRDDTVHMPFRFGRETDEHLQPLLRLKSAVDADQSATLGVLGVPGVPGSAENVAAALAALCGAGYVRRDWRRQSVIAGAETVAPGLGPAYSLIIGAGGLLNHDLGQAVHAAESLQQLGRIGWHEHVTVLIAGFEECRRRTGRSGRPPDQLILGPADGHLRRRLERLRVGQRRIVVAESVQQRRESTAAKCGSFANAQSQRADCAGAGAGHPVKIVNKLRLRLLLVLNKPALDSPHQLRQNEAANAAAVQAEQGVAFGVVQRQRSVVTFATVGHIDAGSGGVSQNVVTAGRLRQTHGSLGDCCSPPLADAFPPLFKLLDEELRKLTPPELDRLLSSRFNKATAEAPLNGFDFGAGSGECDSSSGLRHCAIVLATVVAAVTAAGGAAGAAVGADHIKIETALTDPGCWYGTPHGQVDGLGRAGGLAASRIGAGLQQQQGAQVVSSLTGEVQRHFSLVVHKFAHNGHVAIDNGQYEWSDSANIVGRVHSGNHIGVPQHVYPVEVHSNVAGRVAGILAQHFAGRFHVFLARQQGPFDALQNAQSRGISGPDESLAQRRALFSGQVAGVGRGEAQHGGVPAQLGLHVDLDVVGPLAVASGRSDAAKPAPLNPGWLGQVGRLARARALLAVSVQLNGKLSKLGVPAQIVVGKIIVKAKNAGTAAAGAAGKADEAAGTDTINAPTSEASKQTSASPAPPAAKTASISQLVGIGLVRRASDALTARQRSATGGSAVNSAGSCLSCSKSAMSVLPSSRKNSRHLLSPTTNWRYSGQRLQICAIVGIDLSKQSGHSLVVGLVFNQHEAQLGGRSGFNSHHWVLAVGLDAANRQRRSCLRSGRGSSRGISRSIKTSTCCWYFSPSFMSTAVNWFTESNSISWARRRSPGARRLGSKRATGLGTVDAASGTTATAVIVLPLAIGQHWRGLLSSDWNWRLLAPATIGGDGKGPNSGVHLIRRHELPHQIETIRLAFDNWLAAAPELRLADLAAVSPPLPNPPKPDLLSELCDPILASSRRCPKLLTELGPPPPPAPPTVRRRLLLATA
uniref:ABC transporter domain-containing protein n=1 Tax=Macrostomum lignano TaxID=282301 RepID=A0A1I8G3L7_9PLAT